MAELKNVGDQLFSFGQPCNAYLILEQVGRQGVLLVAIAS